MSELFISGGRVIDPEQGSMFPADVLIREGAIAKIAAWGEMPCPKDAAWVDAAGCFVCPGFIDPHGHIDGHEYTAELSLLQGITTSVGGNCGFSPLDIENFLKSQREFPIHQIELVGLCALRHGAGAQDDFLPATAEQIKAMEALCERALEEGAAGVSLGPGYTPGASFEEMAALCRLAAKYGRPVSIDTRMNSMTDLDSLQEAIDLAKASGCTMIVSHFVYQYGVGVEEEALKMIHRAREEGVDMQLDSGMYKDWCSSIGSALFEPTIMKDNGIELYHLRVITGRHLGSLPDRQMYEHLREKHACDAVVVNTGIQEAVYTIQRDPLTMVSTDTGAYAPGEGHPQIAGSFPRYLKEMVREGRGLSWEDAIRRITLHPAKVFGLEKKGRMRAGCDADLVVFDPNAIADTANYPGLGHPNAVPEGIACVIVGGKIAAQHGKVTGEKAGCAIAMGCAKEK